MVLSASRLAIRNVSRRELHQTLRGPARQRDDQVVLEAATCSGSSAGGVSGMRRREFSGDHVEEDQTGATKQFTSVVRLTDRHSVN